MKWLIALTILFFASNLPSFAAAQNPASTEEEDSQVCLAIAYGWSGSSEDIKQIKEIPVPNSYKAQRGGDCGGYVDSRYLIAWHLRFGTENTVEQALRFFEKRDGESDTMAAKMDRDLTDALADLDKEFHIEDEKDDSRLDFSQLNKLRLFIQNTPSVSKLRLIKDTLNSNLLIRVNHYLSAAEIFGSPRLGAHARKIFTQYEAIEKRLLPIRDGGSSDLDPLVSQAMEYVQDSSSRDLTSMEVELRLAVLEAQLTPDAKTIDHAREILQRRYRPAYANAPKVAFGGGENFCDLYEERFLNDWEREIAKACKDDSGFVNKAMAYGYADAMLAILTDANQMQFGKWDWQEYVLLHQKNMIYNSGQRNYLTGDNERVINLKLALADRHFQKTKAKEKGGWSYEDAWQLLAELSALVNPADNPVRFRQIAERAIAVDVEMQKEDEGWRQQDAQLLAYYRLNLKNIDKLVIGEVP